MSSSSIAVGGSAGAGNKATTTTTSSTAATARTTAAALSGTTKELFSIWQASCFEGGGDGGGVVKKDKGSGLLRKEARSFFRTLARTTNVVAGGGGEGGMLTTRSSHEEALALLVQQLGSEAFRSSRRQEPRLRALETLLGALEGCLSRSGASSSIFLSDKLLDLLGTFLLNHCKPIARPRRRSEDDDDDEQEDLEDEIRDLALSALTVLVGSRSPPLPDPSDGSAAGAAAEETELGAAAGTASVSVFLLVESIRRRIRLAQRGVESRCAQLDDEEDLMDVEEEYNGYYANDSSRSMQPPIQAGLSLLPRSRRSLCFDLLGASVDSISTMLRPISDANVIKLSALSLEKNDPTLLPNFARFVSNCLRGESDPRCLLQLLHLFRATADCFLPLFEATSNSRFPITDLFDAIAPYYPIQFTPPPNNVHGITKSGLRDALLDIMGYTSYDGMATKDNKDSMLNLSLAIVIERLVPLPGDEPTNMTEKYEALRDLSTLLMLPDSPRAAAKSRVDALDPLFVRQLSDTFLIVHREAATEAVTKAGPDKLQAKATADLCRSIVSKVALECEQCAAVANGILWQCFVREPMQALSSALVNSPFQGRVSIAYMACLTSCGGPKTLLCGLERGLAPLLEKCSFKSPQADIDDMTTSTYGVGAFFSACRTSLSRPEKIGVTLFPHPLQNYSARAVRILNTIISNSTEQSISLRIAAVRSMESVLMASPSYLFGEGDDSDSDCWICFLKRVTGPLLVRNLSDVDLENRGHAEWLRACAQTSGCVLGYAAGHEDDVTVCPESDNVLESNRFRSIVNKDFFPDILSSATSAAGRKDYPRYDWIALAKACSTRPAASVRIVAYVAKSLQSALDSNAVEKVQVCTNALDILFRKGGDEASKAYLELSSPNPTSFDVIKSLTSFSIPDNARKNGGYESGFGTSMLQLPPSEEERMDLRAAVDRSYKIVTALRRAYQRRIAAEQLKKLVLAVSKTLPPLTDPDTVKLSILLPMLSAALVSSASKKDDLSLIEEEQSLSLAADLAEFSINAEFYARSRSYAMLCVQSLLSSYTARDADKCPCLVLLENLAMPSLRTACDCAIAGDKRSQKDAPSVGDCFSLLAVLGSAAARRGGISSKTADDVVTLLVGIACTRKGRLSSVTGDVVDTSGFVLKENNIPSAEDGSLLAASALGSILSTESGTNLLWKQRLVHVAAQSMQDHIGPLSASAPQPIGVVACACYLVSTTKTQFVGKSVLNALALVIARGLSMDSSCTNDVAKLLLGALLKLLAVAPDSLSGNGAYLVTGIMRMFASFPEPTSGIAVKLLALQALDSLARVDGSLVELTVVKPAVVSVLATSMNHPSSVLRHAAIEVRNAWYVAGNI